MPIQTDVELFSLGTQAVVEKYLPDTTSDTSVWVRQYIDWEEGAPASTGSRPAGEIREHSRAIVDGGFSRRELDVKKPFVSLGAQRAEREVHAGAKA